MSSIGGQTNYDAHFAEKMNDPAFRAAYEEMQPLVAFGHALAVLREQRGMTQEALAEAMSVKRAAIARLERGDDAPTMTTLLNLTQVLDAQLTIDANGHIAFGPHRKQRSRRGAPITAR